MKQEYQRFRDRAVMIMLVAPALLVYGLHYSDWQDGPRSM